MSGFPDMTSTSWRSESHVGGDSEPGGEEDEECTYANSTVLPLAQSSLLPERCTAMSGSWASSDGTPFEPPFSPDLLRDLLDPNNDSESSRIAVQTLNAYREHLRWTYDRLLAHYHLCEKIECLLRVQEGVLQRALYHRMREDELEQQSTSDSEA